MTPEQIRATLPAYTDLMWPTVVVLREQGRSGTTQEINAAVVERMGLTEEQQSLQRERDNTTVIYELKPAPTRSRVTSSTKTPSPGSMRSSRHCSS